MPLFLKQRMSEQARRRAAASHGPKAHGAALLPRILKGDAPAASEAIGLTVDAMRQEGGLFAKPYAELLEAALSLTPSQGAFKALAASVPKERVDYELNRSVLMCDNGYSSAVLAKYPVQAVNALAEEVSQSKWGEHEAYSGLTVMHLCREGLICCEDAKPILKSAALHPHSEPVVRLIRGFLLRLAQRGTLQDGARFEEERVIEALAKAREGFPDEAWKDLKASALKPAAGSRDESGS